MAKNKNFLTNKSVFEVVKNMLEDVINILDGVINIFDHLENKIDRDKLPGSVAFNLYLITIKSNHLIDKLQK